MSTQNAVSDCDCEFDYPEEDSWHYLRTCEACGHQWGGLHCPHDGYQNPCPACGIRPDPKSVTPPPPSAVSEPGSDLPSWVMPFFWGLIVGGVVMGAVWLIFLRITG